MKGLLQKVKCLNVLAVLHNANLRINAAHYSMTFEDNLNFSGIRIGMVQRYRSFRRRFYGSDSVRGQRKTKVCGGRLTRRCHTCGGGLRVEVWPAGVTTMLSDFRSETLVAASDVATTPRRLVAVLTAHCTRTITKSSQVVSLKILRPSAYSQLQPAVT